MDQNVFGTPQAVAPELPPKQKRWWLVHLWDIGLLAAASWYTYQMLGVILYLHGLLQKMQPSGKLLVRDTAAMVDVAALIAWSWFLAGAFGSWTWAKVGPALRWLYAAGFVIFLFGSVVRLSFERWDGHPQNGLGGYVLFVGLFVLFAFPIVVLGTGYVGLIASRIQRTQEAGERPVRSVSTNPYEPPQEAPPNRSAPAPNLHSE